MEVTQIIGKDGITFEHPADGYSKTYSWRQIREAWTIRCEHCGVQLSSFTDLVESMDAALAKARVNPNPRQRQIAVESLSRVRTALLHG